MYILKIHSPVLGAYHSLHPGCKSILDREKPHDQSPVAFDLEESVAEMVFSMAEGTENSSGYLRAAAAAVVASVHRLLSGIEVA
jgi:hypothetical protein